MYSIKSIREKIWWFAIKSKHIINKNNSQYTNIIKFRYHLSLLIIKSIELN